MKCIVAEDDPFWSAEICQALTAEGVHAIAAPDGAEALRLLKRHPDSGLVLDIILPDRDGLEVLRDARSERPSVPVVAISGGGRLGGDFYLKLADAFGANAVIQKPFTPAQLVQAWKTATGTAV